MDRKQSLSLSLPLFSLSGCSCVINPIKRGKGIKESREDWFEVFSKVFHKLVASWD